MAGFICPRKLQEREMGFRYFSMICPVINQVVYPRRKTMSLDKSRDIETLCALEGWVYTSWLTRLINEETPQNLYTQYICRISVHTLNSSTRVTTLFLLVCTFRIYCSHPLYCLFLLDHLYCWWCESLILFGFLSLNTIHHAWNKLIWNSTHNLHSTPFPNLYQKFTNTGS